MGKEYSVTSDKGETILTDEHRKTLKIARGITANIPTETLNEMPKALKQVRNAIKDLSDFATNAQKAFGKIIEYTQNIPNEKIELLEYCLEQCDMSIYDNIEFIEYLLNSMDTANSESFNDKQTFWDNLNKEWQKEHPEAEEKNQNIIYEKIKAQKFTQKLNTKTVNLLETKKYDLSNRNLEDIQYQISGKLEIDVVTYFTDDFLENFDKGKIKALPHEAIDILNAITTAECILSGYKSDNGYIFISWNDLFRLLHKPIRASGQVKYTEDDIKKAKRMLGYLHGTFLEYSVPHELTTKNGVKIKLTGGYLVEWKTAMAYRSKNATRGIQGIVIKENAVLDEAKALAALNERDKGMELIQIPWDCYDIKKTENVVFEPQMYEKSKVRFDNFKSADLTTSDVNMTTERRILLEYILKEVFTEYRGNDHKLYVDRALQMAEINEKDHNRNIYVKFIETILINLTLHGYIGFGFTRHKAYRKVKFYQYFKTKKCLNIDKKRWKK